MVKQLFSSYLQAQPRCKQLCCSLLCYGCTPEERQALLVKKVHAQRSYQEHLEKEGTEIRFSGMNGIREKLSHLSVNV